MNFDNRFVFGLNYVTEDYNYLFGETSDAMPQELKVDKLLYILLYEYNDLNYDYQYLEGFQSIFGFQYVPSTDDTQLPDFLMGRNDFMYFKRIKKKGNWAS